MIYEIAVLPVKPDRIDAFARAFGEVAHLLSRARGYQGHSLMQGIEQPSDFTLIVRWQSLEDHTPHFEASADHDAFMKGLQDHLAAEPRVQHARTTVPTAELDVLSA